MDAITRMPVPPARMFEDSLYPEQDVREAAPPKESDFNKLFPGLLLFPWVV